MAFRKTHCKRGHAFTERNTDWSSGHRKCRMCKSLREREHYAQDAKFREKKRLYQAAYREKENRACH